MRPANRAVRGQALDLELQPELASPGGPTGWESVVKAPDNTGIYRHDGPAGTAVAIIPLGIGGATLSARTESPGWGGARNSASRHSDALTIKQTAEIIAAAQFATRAGLPLNRHLTIHWEAAGIPDSRAAPATAAFLTLARDWLRKRGAALAWVWVRENGYGKGSHAHILLHCPPELARDFSGLQRRWLRRVTGKPYSPRVIRTARIGGTLRAFQTAPTVYAKNLVAVVAYLLKGAAPEVARALGIERLECGGRIIGKRAATSQNIGRTARAQHSLK